jgi:heat shock protein beta
LVSPSVKVSSIPPATADNPEPVQYTFESDASGDEFRVFADPRGNTLLEQGNCGTEVTLSIEAGSGNEWVLDNDKLEELVEKHSQFSSNFPIYLRKSSADKEEAADGEGEHRWVKLNKKQPLWMRDPKSVSEQEYKDFYAALDPSPDAETAGWTHWKGDSGAGVSYRAMMYIPAKLPEDFWNKGPGVVRNIRLMVRRVFITDDFGEDYLPRWLSFLKIVVDADDLPLNVSRETLQSNKFLRQLKRILVRKAIDMFTRISKDEPEKWEKIHKTIGNAIRIGMVESDGKDRVKLAGLLRFASTRGESVSLEDVSTGALLGNCRRLQLTEILCLRRSVCRESKGRTATDLLPCRRRRISGKFGTVAVDRETGGKGL